MEARLLHGLQQGHTRGDALPDLRGATVQTGPYLPKEALSFPISTAVFGACTVHGLAEHILSLYSISGRGDLLHSAELAPVGYRGEEIRGRRDLHQPKGQDHQPKRHR